MRDQDKQEAKYNTIKKMIDFELGEEGLKYYLLTSVNARPKNYMNTVMTG